MSYISRNVFGSVIACDPYIIDGDFRRTWGACRRRSCSASPTSSRCTCRSPTRRAGSVDARLLSLMTKGSFLVNTARGAVVNCDDVLAALESGRLDGAALDVLPQEPPDFGHPLLSTARCSSRRTPPSTRSTAKGSSGPKRRRI
jgi:D-3-phosphoglycerate dehydrogenase